MEELAHFANAPARRAEFPWLSGMNVEVSARVAAELCAGTHNILHLSVRDRHWWTFLKESWQEKRDYDVSFTIFGPEYSLRRAKYRIVGFADVTSIYPRPKGVRKPTIGRRARQWLRGIVSRYLHKKPDLLIVETDEIKNQLMLAIGRRPETVRVVSNTLHGVFSKPEQWRPLSRVPERAHHDDSLICYVTRGYPHKNLDFLGEVGAILTSRGVGVRFVVTLTDSEWRGLSDRSRENLQNIGPVSSNQLPALYLSCDASIFPSLLEAFSIMPVETMFMERLLFASNRKFVRAVCRDAPIYIDPTDAAATADVIVRTLSQAGLVSAHVERGRKVALALPSSSDRARAYLHCIDSACPRESKA